MSPSFDPLFSLSNRHNLAGGWQVQVRKYSAPDIDARAKRANVTTSELVRRAVVTYEPDDDMNEIRVLVDELASVASRMDKKLDAALAKVAAYEKEMADNEALRAAARAELEASGAVWPFELHQNDKPARARA